MSKEVKEMEKVGVTLDMETGEYNPVYNDETVTVTTEDAESMASEVAKEVAKVTETPVKTKVQKVKKSDKRHDDVLAVLAALPTEYKRNDFVKMAVEVLGYEIPFNKKVREVYSEKQENGSYVAREMK